MGVVCVCLVCVCLCRNVFMHDKHSADIPAFTFTNHWPWDTGNETRNGQVFEPQNRNSQEKKWLHLTLRNLN